MKVLHEYECAISLACGQFVAQESRRIFDQLPVDVRYERAHIAGFRGLPAPARRIPYRPEERYAAGDYPSLKRAWRGAARVDSRQPLHPEYRYRVVAYHGYAPCGSRGRLAHYAGDAHSFELRPFDFFNRNPALDLPSR